MLFQLFRDNCLAETKIGWMDSFAKFLNEDCSDVFLPARHCASADNSDRNVSVRPSVCLSRAGIVKKKKASGMISLPSGNPKTLFF